MRPRRQLTRLRLMPGSGYGGPLQRADARATTPLARGQDTREGDRHETQRRPAHQRPPPRRQRPPPLHRVPIPRLSFAPRAQITAHTTAPCAHITAHIAPRPHHLRKLLPCRGQGWRAGLGHDERGRAVGQELPEQRRARSTGCPSVKEPPEHRRLLVPHSPHRPQRPPPRPGGAGGAVDRRERRRGDCTCAGTGLHAPACARDVRLRADCARHGAARRLRGAQRRGAARRLGAGAAHQDAVSRCRRETAARCARPRGVGRETSACRRGPCVFAGAGRCETSRRTSYLSRHCSGETAGRSRWGCAEAVEVVEARVEVLEVRTTAGAGRRWSAGAGRVLVWLGNRGREWVVPVPGWAGRWSSRAVQPTCLLGLGGLEWQHCMQYSPLLVSSGSIVAG
jgi:hypothetical protein